MIDPDFISKCVAIIRNPDTVLCHSLISYIDESSNFIRNNNVYLHKYLSKINVRFQELLAEHLCYPIFRLIHSSTLKSITLQGIYNGTRSHSL